MTTAKQCFLCGTALSALMLAAASPAVAETPSASAGPQAAVLEELVVTARKRAENLNDVPGALVAVQPDTLRALKITNAEILSQIVPSFTQSTAAPNPRYYLRGVGSGSNASFEQAVGTFIDGEFVGRGEEGRMPYYDLEGVVVQLGPQVVLYGNSTTAGALSITTKKPTGEFSADLDASYEFKNHETSLQGDLNLPISDKVRIRIAAYDDNLTRGWITTARPGISPPNVTHDPRIHDTAERVTVQLLPTDDLEVLLKYEGAQTRNLGGTLQIVTNQLGYPFVEGAFNTFRQAGNGAPFAPKSQDFDRLNSHTLLATVNYKLGSGTLTSLTGYNWYRYGADTEGDMTALPIFDFGQTETYKQASEELRYASSFGDKFDYIVGGYYQRDKLTLRSRTDVNPAALFPFAAFNPSFASFNHFPAFARTTYLDQNETDYSAFIDATYHVTPKLKVEGGVRYTDVEKTGVQGAHATDIGTTTRDPAFDTPFAALPPIGSPPIPGTHNSFYSLVFAVPHDLTNLTLKERHLMPEVIVQYELGGNSMVYAKAVRGAKSGGFDWLYGGDAKSFTALASGPQSATFRPETATSYEVGLRGELLERRLQFGLTAFHNDVKDLQVSVFNGGTNYVVGNADTKSQGLEGDFTFRPWRPLTLTGVFAANDSKFTRFAGAACTYQQTVAFAAAHPGVTCVQDLAGIDTPTPALMYNLGAAYVVDVGAYVVTTRVNWAYRGKYNISDSNDPLLEQKAFGLLDARIALSPASQRWELSLFGKNLTNRLWSDVGAQPPLIAGATFADTQRTLQVGVAFRTRFGS